VCSWLEYRGIALLLGSKLLFCIVCLAEDVAVVVVKKMWIAWRSNVLYSSFSFNFEPLKSHACVALANTHD
jgi:hypothetical protein